MKIFTSIEKFLTRFMNALADYTGRPFVFATILVIALLWFILGFFIEYDTWFDIMDLTIFISTFFLLFIVQSSQNADTRAIQDKLDEIIDALPNADSTKEKQEKRIKRGEKK